MLTKLPALDDNEFLNQFESLQLDKDYFNHLGHLRIAWIYLGQHPVDQASILVCKGIKAYAESLGAKDKFSLTVTDSLVRIMAKRRGVIEDRSWSRFQRWNQDLTEHALSVLHQYFTPERLAGSTAKVSLLAPDKNKL